MAFPGRVFFPPSADPLGLNLPEKVKVREAIYPLARRINPWDAEWFLGIYDLFDALNLPPGIDSLREIVARASRKPESQVTDFDELLHEVETCSLEILEESYESENLLEEVRELRRLVAKLKNFERLRAQLIYAREESARLARHNMKLKDEVAGLRAQVKELEW